MSRKAAVKEELPAVAGTDVLVKIPQARREYGQFVSDEAFVLFLKAKGVPVLRLSPGGARYLTRRAVDLLIEERARLVREQNAVAEKALGPK